MKKTASITLLTLIVLLATTAFAADAKAAPTSTKFDLTINQPTTVAGTTIKAGDYKVFVDLNGDEAKVRIADGKRELVNTTAHYQYIAGTSGQTAISVDKDRNVHAMYSNKIKGGLVFESPTTSEGSSK